MKDILMLAGRKPYPLDDGWRLRTYHLLSALAETGAAVDLLVFDETGDRSTRGLADLCREVVVVPREKAYSPVDLVRGLLFPTPFSVLNFHDRGFAREYARLTAANDYGYIQVEDVVLAQYTANTDVPKMLDMHNIESELLGRFAARTDSVLKGAYAKMAAKKLARYELEVSELFDGVVVCSPEEKVWLGEKGFETEVTVIPNGVDCGFYAGLESEEKEEDALVFVGSMDYHANISGVEFFAAEVLPLLVRQRPRIKVYVVGKNPPERITALDGDNLVVTGGVPDVRPYLGRVRVSIVPLLVGGGTRLKILEAMAAGLPVVSTSLGAEGLDLTHGENIMIGDTAEDFAARVLDLLDDPQRGQAMVESGTRFVARNYDWSVVGEQHRKRVLALMGEDA